MPGFPYTDFPSSPTSSTASGTAGPGSGALDSGALDSGPLDGSTPSPPPPAPAVWPGAPGSGVLDSGPLDSGPLDAPPPALGLLLGSDLGTVCAAARDALAAAFVPPRAPGAMYATAASRVVNVAIDKRPMPDQVPQLLVVPGPIRSVKAVVEGAGRHCPLRVGQITVVYIARHARDKVGTANYMLASAVEGIYPVAMQQIDDILTTEFLTDAQGNPLTATPMEFVGGGYPSLYGNSFEFSGTEWTWEFQFLAPLTINPGD